MCPRSSDPFYLASYYIKWVTTFWSHSTKRLWVIGVDLGRSDVNITLCSRSSDLFHKVTNLKYWVTTSWKRTHSNAVKISDLAYPFLSDVLIYAYILHSMCPRSSDPFYIVSYFITWVTTSWTYSMQEVVNKSI